MESKEKAVVTTDFFISPFATLDRKTSSRFDRFVLLTFVSISDNSWDHIRKTKEIASVINRVLESVILTEEMPRSLIEVHVTAIEADGGMRCAGINAAILACIDAGIPIRGLATAVASCYLEDRVLLGMLFSSLFSFTFSIFQHL